MSYEGGEEEPAYVWTPESSDKDIEAYLVAKPVRKLPKCYSRKQILAQTDQICSQKAVRAALPNVEINTIKFGFNQAVVREEEMVNLDRIGQWMENILASHPKEMFAIEGHTDLVGSDTDNLKLSRSRAVGVKHALVSYFNIAPQSLTIVGLGERFPRLKTEKAERKNRRIIVRRLTPLICKVAKN